MTKPTKGHVRQRRLRSAWASAQSDQSLRCVLCGWLRTQTFFMRTAKTLIRLGGCRLCAQRKLRSAWASPTLIRVFAVPQHSVGFVMRRLNYIINQDFFNLKGYWYYSFELIFEPFLFISDKSLFMVRNCWFCLLMSWYKSRSTAKPTNHCTHRRLRSACRISLPRALYG